ncbi:hypothetical protein HER39_09965 [Arthrobacter deserti]|uniref:Uncharacterized protein n=1 Tax=Arthrobacter deserti TaxID=1742687 RepID=A0ABX1JQ80_9MICC|nr:hypothetical protein [Arthrobacter deserti]
MAWWQGGSKERLARLTPQEMGETYARREWVTVPLESGRAHVTGPYVDFLCTDEYTVTMTLPVGGARPVGGAGADVFVESLEGVFGADLAAVHPAATLVNRSGRVVVSADPQLAAGTVLAPGWQSAAGVPRARGELWGGAELQAEACSRLPLGVVYPRV